MEGTLRDYLKERHQEEFLEIRFSDNKTQTFDLQLDTSDFLSCFPELAIDIYQHPQTLLDAIHQSVVSELSVTQLPIDVRLVNIPGLRPIKISDIGVEHKDELVQLIGTVVRCGNSKTLATVKTYRCQACKEEFQSVAKLELYGDVDLPHSCPSRSVHADTKAKFKSKRCKGTVFSEVPESAIWKDYREVKLQEPFGSIAPGRVPQSIWVLLEGNLVNSCSPGDDVTVIGRVILRWGALSRDKDCDVQLCVVAYTIDADVDKTRGLSQTLDPTLDQQFRVESLQGFAPSLLGLDHVKLGLLLCAIGGEREELKGVTLRGHCHALVVGEPGTGKSSLLKFTSQLKARSVLTNALGTSKAGLTLSAVKEGGEWMLEAGALVLADCGICCIDDFSLFPKEDRADIFEAMEHQTMSVAKAGMVCQVKTRTTVIAACRPTANKLDPYKDLEQNTGLSTPLLSRFDLVFLLIDDENEGLDDTRADFILNHRWEKSSSSALRTIIAQVQEMQVSLTEPVLVLIRNYYEFSRSRLEQLTVRHLESLLRLVKAHSKLCGRVEACELDAVSIILLMECTARSSGLLSDTSPELCFQSEAVFAQGSQEVREKLLISEIDDNVWQSLG